MKRLGFISISWLTFEAQIQLTLENTKIAVIQSVLQIFEVEFGLCYFYRELYNILTVW